MSSVFRIFVLISYFVDATPRFPPVEIEYKKEKLKNKNRDYDNFPAKGSIEEKIQKRELVEEAKKSLNIKPDDDDSARKLKVGAQKDGDWEFAHITDVHIITKNEEKGQRRLLKSSDLDNLPFYLDLEFQVGEKTMEVSLKQHNSLMEKSARHMMAKESGVYEEIPIVQKMCFYEGRAYEKLFDRKGGFRENPMKKGNPNLETGILSARVSADLCNNEDSTRFGYTYGGRKLSAKEKKTMKNGITANFLLHEVEEVTLKSNYRAALNKVGEKDALEDVPKSIVEKRRMPTKVISLSPVTEETTRKLKEDKAYARYYSRNAADHAHRHLLNADNENHHEFEHRHLVELATDLRTLDYINDVTEYFSQSIHVHAARARDAANFANAELKSVILGSGDANNPEIQPRKLAVNGLPKKFVEVLIVNDKARYDSFGGQTTNVAAMQTHALSVMAEVSTLYKDEADTSHAGYEEYTILPIAVGFVTLTTEKWTDTAHTTAGEIVVSDQLDRFHQYREQDRALLVDHDNGILLSGKDYDGNTVGLAGLGVMCRYASSGSVNMCKSGDNAQGCAGTVAHEMGHNFDMQHDGGGINSACAQSGFVMAAVGTAGEYPSKFSDCSKNNVVDFLTNNYAGTRNPACLENAPTKTIGEAICRDGVVQDGEDCDCLSTDCDNATPPNTCCNGNTCKFKETTYECNQGAACCNNCMFRPASDFHMCRAVADQTCDIPEYCPGGQADCPADQFVYPGVACSTTVEEKTYNSAGTLASTIQKPVNGSCGGGQCQAVDQVCAESMTEAFGEGTMSFSMDEICRPLNDDCGYLICTASGRETSSNGQVTTHTFGQNCMNNFMLHGSIAKVPEGTPCWHKSAADSDRNMGMCQSGKCVLASMLAQSQTCGNGGIDYGEECDCGKEGACADPCCDCNTCRLKSTSTCSPSQGTCCDPSTCAYKASGTECRAKIDGTTCDTAETCTGSSAMCPRDVGAAVGTACTTTSDNRPSTCYGRKCVKSRSEQCRDKGKGQSYFEASGSYVSLGSGCEAFACAASEGSNSYGLSLSLSSFSIMSSDGSTVLETLDLYSGGAVRGTHVTGTNSATWNTDLVKSDLDPNKKYVCKKAKPYEYLTSGSTCTTSQYFEDSVGECVDCDAACSACSGPGPYACTGDCALKNETTNVAYAKDGMGRCPNFHPLPGVNLTIYNPKNFQCVTITTPEPTTTSTTTTDPSATTTTPSGTTTTVAVSTVNQQISGNETTTTSGDSLSESPSGSTTNSTTSGSTTGASGTLTETAGTSGDATTTTVAFDPVKTEIKSTLKFDLPDDTVVADLITNSNFTNTLRKGLALALGSDIPENDITILSITEKTRRRNLDEFQLEKNVRKLAVQKDLEIKYEVTASTPAAKTKLEQTTSGASPLTGEQIKSSFITASNTLGITEYKPLQVVAEPTMSAIVSAAVTTTATPTGGATSSDANENRYGLKSNMRIMIIGAITMIIGLF